MMTNDSVPYSEDGEWEAYLRALETMWPDPPEDVYSTPVEKLVSDVYEFYGNLLEDPANWPVAEGHLSFLTEHLATIRRQVARIRDRLSEIEDRRARHEYIGHEIRLDKLEYVYFTRKHLLTRFLRQYMTEVKPPPLDKMRAGEIQILNNELAARSDRLERYRVLTDKDALMQYTEDEWLGSGTWDDIYGKYELECDELEVPDKLRYTRESYEKTFRAWSKAKRE